jgi:hypothetical protein
MIPNRAGQSNEQRPRSTKSEALEQFEEHRSMCDNISMPRAAAKIKRDDRCPRKIEGRSWPEYSQLGSLNTLPVV